MCRIKLLEQETLGSAEPRHLSDFCGVWDELGHVLSTQHGHAAPGYALLSPHRPALIGLTEFA